MATANPAEKPARWSFDLAQLRRGTKQAKRNGFTPRQSRQADARQVRIIDFERAFATLPLDQRTPLLLLYRDQLSPRHVADILGCSPQLAQFHAARALAHLTDALDRLHLL